MASTRSPDKRTMLNEPLISARGSVGRVGYALPQDDIPERDQARDLPADLCREALDDFPEVSEGEVVRHFTRLSQWNLSAATTLYPLGSCTMKYNPVVNEYMARLPGLAQLHPLTPDDQAQGALMLLAELERCLAEISGMDAISLQPAAGAQGELTGMKLIRAYHQDRGTARKKVLIPASAHGTNPAPAALCSYEVVQVATGSDGMLSTDAVAKRTDTDVAALMVTNPNTLGLFEREILQITDVLHQHGALVYMDGANLNALMGVAKPGPGRSESKRFWSPICPSLGLSIPPPMPPLIGGAWGGLIPGATLLPNPSGGYARSTAILVSWCGPTPIFWRWEETGSRMPHAWRF